MWNACGYNLITNHRKFIKISTQKKLTKKYANEKSYQSSKKIQPKSKFIMFFFVVEYFVVIHEFTATIYTLAMNSVLSLINEIKLQSNELL